METVFIIAACAGALWLVRKWWKPRRDIPGLQAKVFALAAAAAAATTVAHVGAWLGALCRWGYGVATNRFAMQAVHGVEIFTVEQNPWVLDLPRNVLFHHGHPLARRRIGHAATVRLSSMNEHVAPVQLFRHHNTCAHEPLRINADQ